MLIYLQGPSSFLARQAILELKKRYLEKNPDGAELIEIDQDAPMSNWADLQASPLFATTRLAIIKNAGLLSRDQQKNLAGILSQLPKTTVAVVWDGKPPTEPELAKALKAAEKLISTEPPAGPALKKWVAAQAKQFSLELSSEEIQGLVDRFGDDLWAIQTELSTLQHAPKSQASSWQKTAVERPFAIFDLLRGKKWPELRDYLIRAQERGEAMELTLGSLAAAVRKVITDKTEKRRLTDLLADIDIALKTGLIDSTDATALLVAHLPRAKKRLQWGEAWQSLA